SKNVVAVWLVVRENTKTVLDCLADQAISSRRNLGMKRWVLAIGVLFVGTLAVARADIGYIKITYKLNAPPASQSGEPGDQPGGPTPLRPPPDLPGIGGPGGKGRPGGPSGQPDSPPRGRPRGPQPPGILPPGMRPLGPPGIGTPDGGLPGSNVQLEE